MSCGPTPARKQTRRSTKDDVVLGDGEEYATPASDDGLIEVEVGFDDDGFLEWIDDGDEAKEGTDITLKSTGQLPSYRRVGNFSPTSKPGIFSAIISKTVESGMATVSWPIWRISSAMLNALVFTR